MLMNSLFIRYFLSALLVIFLASCDEETPASENMGDGEPSLPELEDKDIIWPLARNDDIDADEIHSPYGPRYIGQYDFHAGADFPADIGTPVYTIMEGRVAEVRNWDGQSSGPGNAVLVHHDDGKSTSYLHLSSISVEEGDNLEIGDRVGSSGETGANWPHLHLGYFKDLPGNNVDERESRNPLEILPHDPVSSIEADFSDEGTVVVTVPAHYMSIRKVELHDTDGETRAADYYDIVAKGWDPRKDQQQFGITFDATRPDDDGYFELTLSVNPDTFELERIVVTDLWDDVLVDERR